MTEVYSTAWVETAKDKLVARLNTLITTMAAGYDPTVSYLYERHVVAKLQLNAITVELDTVEETTEAVAGDGSGPLKRYEMSFGVRIHTEYSDGIMDGEKNARLLNSVINQAFGQLDLSDGYRVMAINDPSPKEYFEDSDTLGGQVFVVIMKHVNYTQ